MLRSFERDIIPMTQSEGMALAPWGAIGGGRFQTKEQLEKRKQEGDIVRGAQGISEEEAKISAALEKVANELGKPGEYSITAVALAYVLQRATYVFPIIGGRRVTHLEDNIKALTIKLSDEQIKYLESQTTFDIGFPLSMIGEDPHRSGETQFNLVSCYANLKWVKHAQPITQEKQ
jgi:aryl-alcohol dehydrogenase-like predicted oxidoreductase